MFYRKKETAKVLQQEWLATYIKDCWIEFSGAKHVTCGQFVNVYPKNAATLLPRPISICEVDEKKNAIRIVYRTVGEGTKEFATYVAGDTISIMGNLGNGFDVEEAKGKNVFLIGGGIGIPPMLQLAKDLRKSGLAKEDIRIILGYRDDELFLADELGQYGIVYIATEDGSVGTKGTVIDVIKENNLQAQLLYSCGPMPMLRALKAYASEQNIKAFISPEERMAFCVGACMGCVCKTTKQDHHSHDNNARVCSVCPVDWEGTR